VSKQAKRTGGTAPGSIRAFFKPMPAAAGSGKGPGNCYRCGSSDHVRTVLPACCGIGAVAARPLFMLTLISVPLNLHRANAVVPRLSKQQVSSSGAQPAAGSVHHCDGEPA